MLMCELANIHLRKGKAPGGQKGRKQSFNFRFYSKTISESLQYLCYFNLTTLVKTAVYSKHGL